METTDNTLLEMQQQMQLLKEKLDSQEIVNDKMLWNAALEKFLSNSFVYCFLLLWGLIHILRYI